MKIVHLMGYFVPELGYQEYYLAKKHAAMGHDVHVIASDMFYPFLNIESMLKEAGIKDTSRRRKPGFSIVDGIKVHRLKSFFEYSDFILCKGGGKVLEEIKPDVVFAHESRQGLTALGAYYKKKFGYKLIVDQHDFYHDIPMHPWNRRLLRFLDYFMFRKFIVNYSFGKADKIVAVTDDTKKFICSAHKINPKKITMLPIGVDADFFRFSKKSREAIRKSYNIKPNDVVFAFSGTIVRRKGVEILLEAFSKIKNENNKLMIIGSGDEDYMTELKNLAVNIKIIDKCIFTGFVSKEKVRDCFSAADVGVWPGNNSVSIMEAMACKLPIIMVRLQLRHLIRKNGVLFSFNDILALKSAIENLSSDKKLRMKMGKESIKIIKEKYSYDMIAMQFLELIKTA